VACGREYFAVYADTCFASFGDRVKNWITLNEPLQTAVNGYDIGIFAPGRYENRTVEPYLAAHHQILAHAAAASIYRSKYKVKDYTCFYLLNYIYFVQCVIFFCCLLLQQNILNPPIVTTLINIINSHA
jgi:beta-glucosidase/6-phospho-beta-glucosidase/beta-galactosidase